mmetsp:Transcript_29078/g.100389  ORF Transcript_29078/g.100389 Transcript_29078/m.100389 type:complete len:123 (-) Transcript_29078:32-400(-)
MYRELASVLRRKYGVRVLMPIDQISANVKTQLSPASSGTISIDVEVTVKDSVTRKDVKKKTAQKVDFWCIDSVVAELILELNAIGKTLCGGASRICSTSSGSCSAATRVESPWRRSSSASSF